MSVKSVQSNEKLAKAIRMRREELNLTIEEAAKRAGVGTKTWCRYESGQAIRQDKYMGVCKALNWRRFPGEEEEDDFINIKKYKKHKAWSKYLENCFGEVAAASFVIGSDILLDYVEADMGELSKMPKGSHIGQIELSFLAGELPEQFCMQYDYDFLYALYTTIVRFRQMAHSGMELIAHSVLEELMLYLVVEMSRYLMESSNCALDNGWEDWIFDLFGDMDIITFLYSDYYLTEDNNYHFKHWMKNQFYCG